MPRPTRGIGDKWIEVCRLLNSRNVDYKADLKKLARLKEAQARERGR